MDLTILGIADCKRVYYDIVSFRITKRKRVIIEYRDGSITLTSEYMNAWNCIIIDKN